ncbi:MAG: hypothetical protein KDD04_08230 [Sinomicrobium sp.]|nr:hypothetical protein [Sinomicrobium sp.]
MRVFTGIQRVPRWLYIMIAPSFLITIIVLINAYVNADADAEKDGLLMAFVIVILAEGLGLFFVISMKQVTRIDPSGIYYSYPPFKLKEVHIPKLTIEHYDLVTYTTLYYGYRVGFRNALRKRPSITMIGISKAVRFTFKDGKTLLIGTRKPDELMRTLNYIMQHEENNAI